MPEGVIGSYGPKGLSEEQRLNKVGGSSSKGTEVGSPKVTTAGSGGSHRGGQQSYSRYK